jgi:uroporphyrinogen decarboxylase
LQVLAGADVIQIFDSWVGALSLTDYREYAFEASKAAGARGAADGRAGDLLWRGDRWAAERDGRTGADVIGLDWRQPLDEGWRAVGHGHAVQGNLDPITLFAPLEVLELAREGDSARGQRPARAHLQPWPRHCSRHAGGECAGGGAHGARVPAAYAWRSANG